ncbi:MAG: N-formylglutamate deformylase [Rhodobacterales bacterium 32-67-9]|nr:MAG: N-formylglutamate deformylase [Rhodobacterales bacterium 32-67-9]
MNIVDVLPGDGPVILGQPHGGTWLPDALTARLNPNGRGLADTDWHIGQLYDGLLSSATVVRSNVHRYAIDANRDPAGVSLYPGQNTTSLCPVSDFDGAAIWQDGQDPSEDEILARRAAYHAPYHEALAEEVARVTARHGVAIIYDCHSIRSEIPFLFEGLLPVFSIGTNDGQTCAGAIADATVAACAAESHVLNGRFKGGWTTRHYGRPETGVHAIQMELAQRAYLAAETPPWSYDPARAGPTRATLHTILAALDRLARSGALA